MDLNELRVEIDAVDRELVALLERRLDVAANIADWKQSQGLPVLDASREKAKIAAVRELCRPETADLIAGLYGPIMAACREHEERRMEKSHGK